MKATKCSKCGFVGFANEGFCKRCGSSVDLNNQAPIDAPEVEKSRSGLWFKLKIVLAIVGVVAVTVVGYYKLTKYFDETPMYLAAISSSETFKEPVTVRVNRKEIPPPRTIASYLNTEEKKAGSAVTAADVLEALGLITISVDTSVRTVKGPGQYYGGMVFDGRLLSAPGLREQFKDVKSNTLVISLTEKGRLEAVNWKEADERLTLTNVRDPLQGQSVLPWWIIPIGDREILRIESVKPAPGESNLETLMIDFRWRWRPNKLGESFDVSNAAVITLPTKAQEAVNSLKLSSQSENFGIAKLQKKYGRWECVEITFPGELTKKVFMS